MKRTVLMPAALIIAVTRRMLSDTTVLHKTQMSIAIGMDMGTMITAPERRIVSRRMKYHEK